MSSPNYAGIDIAKRNFVIGIHGKDKTKTETNNPKGFEHPAACLQKHRGGLIVATRTGIVSQNKKDTRQRAADSTSSTARRANAVYFLFGLTIHGHADGQPLRAAD